MFKKIIALVLSFGFILFGLTAPVLAEDKPSIWLQISPVSNRISLKPGQQLEYALTVQNIGKDSFKYTAKASPYSITNESYDINFSKETPRTQLSRWVTFKNADGNYQETASFTIKPDEKQIISYRVSVPNDIPAGGQYAVIFITPDADNSGNFSGIRTISQAGSVIYGRTIGGDTRQSSEISEYHFDTFLTSGNIKVQSKIKNTGNTDFATQHSFSVKSIFGKTLYEKNNIYDILPDTERKINLEWEKTPFIGIFQVSYKVNALSNSKEQTKIVVIVPVFVIIIALLLLTASVVWTIILIRRRNQSQTKLIVQFDKSLREN